jgi:hypothetical protein
MDNSKKLSLFGQQSHGGFVDIEVSNSRVLDMAALKGIVGGSPLPIRGQLGGGIIGGGDGPLMYRCCRDSSDGNTYCHEAGFNCSGGGCAEKTGWKDAYCSGQ